MSTFNEIKDLRKSGKLDEAFALAKAEMEKDRENIWNKRAMAWVLYEYIDANANVKNRDKLVDYLLQLKELNLNSEEAMVFNSILWALRSFFADCEEQHWCDNKFLSNMMNAIQEFPFTKPSDAYSALLNAVYGMRSEWDEIHLFLEWWNLDYLSSKDHESFRLDNGKSILSLAERCYILYSKWLEESENKEKISDFLPKLAFLVEKHPDMTYPPYYLAKLYLKIGESAKAIEALKPFAKLKHNDFWVWELLGDAQSEREQKLAFYCRALQCRSEEKMIVSLREDMSLLLAELGYCTEAKFEAEKALETRRRNEWKIPNDLAALSQTEWYKNTIANKDNKSFYVKHAEQANEFLFGEKKSYCAMVTYVNQEKKFISFVTEEKKSGFFKVPPIFKKQLNIFDVIKFKATEIQEEKPTDVHGLQKTEGNDNKIFFRTFEGILHKTAKGFAFIDNVYIPQEMIRNRTDSEPVKGKAGISFNKKDNKWGWRAITIN